ncbi:AIPR family protein [Labrenzia sp. OB1]|uniref:AIPR family protein n=1 Tax=Labrenzia sp. OB1 TaxID=1561204 RepID=UPI0007B23855|nr:AIPR family protein [Labrenzia sp. OB1]KZM48966.1 abortive phage infection protein [Labrenzia sp. OB1]
MNEAELINSFAKDLLQEVIASTDSQEAGSSPHEEFTRAASDWLIEAGEIDEIHVVYHRSRGMQFSGYAINGDEDCLDLFISLFDPQLPPASISKTQCGTAFRQAEACLKKGLAGHHSAMEEASEAYDAFQRIWELRNQLTRCRVYLLTNGLVTQEEFPAENIGDISVNRQLWDIRRICRFANSGKKFEPIEIDFRQEFGSPISCLSLVDPGSDYQGYLAVIPGAMLASIYDHYGPRLLERNVRSFLQARGKVNKGIRQTIIKEPHRFFAYNNGITATADHIDFEKNGSSLQITKIRNLQIVNGGQTTASLAHTAKKDKADLSGIFVQCKLSVIPEEHIDNIVPLISRYANSQNKVNDADFYANDPFHVNIEELSRTVWAPPAYGSNRNTRWFYERARGQYADAKARETTPARKRQFEALSPSRQKFTKTDLAKYENTWMQLPHIVSLGAQKNFNDFSVRLKERGAVKVDITYFQHLIAKAILFKRADRIVQQQAFGGYKANIVTYTLAWLAHHTKQCIDLNRIWSEQDISPTIQEAIKTVSRQVHAVITNPPNNRNITEWCKRKECWDQVSGTKIDIGEQLQQELITVSPYTTNSPDRGINAPNEEDSELIRKVSEIPADEWFRLSKWAKETNNLQSWQRSLAYSIGRAINSGRPISAKQAKQATIVMSEATRLGLKF